MKPICILPLLLCLCFTAHAQQANNKINSKASASTGDIPPEFPGGMDAFNKYVKNNVKYPKVIQLIDLRGTIHMRFIVDTDGNISEVDAIDTLGAGCEEEARRVLINSPKWRPGIQNGNTVRVEYTIPISFNARKAIISLKELEKSHYTFIFLIKNRRYTTNEAEPILGKTFLSNIISSIRELHDDKYKTQKKEQAFLLRIEG